MALKLLSKLLSLLLFVDLHLRGQGQSTGGELRQDENCKVPLDVKEAMDVANEVAADMHVELLQRDLKLSQTQTQKRLELETKKATVANWTCEKSLAYHSMTLPDNSETKIQILNLTTGKYDDFIDVKLDVIKPDKIRSMNTCALNPKDEKLYCSIQVNKNANDHDNIGCFLVRIDQESNLEYVTKLYNYRYSAAFDDDDTIYVGGQQNWNEHQLTVIKNVSTITGVSSYKVWDNGNNVPESKIGESTVSIDPTSFEVGADFEVIKADWEVPDKNFSYLVSVSGPNLVVVRVSPGPYKLWTLDHTTFTPPLGPASPPRVWGAAWKWDNEFYASDDGGAGLYMLNKKKINLKSGEAELVRQAAAAETTWNDGFSCGPKTPGEIEPKKINCSFDYYQVYKEGGPASKDWGKTKIRRMTGGGKWEDYFEVAMQSTKYGCKMQSLNACAVNGKNNKLYCQAEMDCGSRLVVLDKDQVGFIMHAPASWCFSGIFDSEFHYWLYCTSGLIRVDNIDEYMVYEYATTGGAMVLTQKPDEDTVYKTFSNFQGERTSTYNLIGADMVTYTDEDKTYLLSIVESKENYVSVVDITDPETPRLVEGKGTKKLWESTGLYAPFECHSDSVNAGQNCGMHYDWNTWGSAWRIEKEKKIVFGRDETGELFELEKLDFDDKKASFKFYKALGNASWHDGFSCIENITGIDTGA